MDEITSGLMFKAAKLIVPHDLREEMLNKIHEPHLGVVKYKERAKSIFNWPNMSPSTKDAVSQCDICNERPAILEICYSPAQYQKDHGSK